MCLTFYTKSHLSEFITGAIKRGYYNDTTMFYNASTQDAIDYYNNRDNISNQRYMILQESLNVDLKIISVPEYDEYIFSNLCVLQNESISSELETWKMILIIAGCILIIISIITVLFKYLCHIKKLKPQKYSTFPKNDKVASQGNDTTNTKCDDTVQFIKV